MEIFYQPSICQQMCFQIVKWSQHNITQQNYLKHKLLNFWYVVRTHPHKKGPVMKNYTRHLTSFPMVIYQAEHNLWCPVNVGWENFAQLQKFQVK